MHLNQSLPIGIHEFYLALITQLPKAFSRRGRIRSGIAVSGGVDSMALSCLCKALKEKKLLDIKFRAFIVDHKARAESSREARRVAQNLRALGVPCTILRLDWRTNTSLPIKPSNFETNARKFRYQALGSACRHFRISSLFLAHHEDDQAETVLIRLLGRYIGDGLRGMQAAVDIPECHGKYGIHASGDSNSYLQNVHRGHSTKRDRRMEIALASGGIHILRPLLKFSKARLMATCINARITWVEDVTNLDYSLTIRNTVRKLLAQDVLPKALRRSNLLLASKRVEQRIGQRQIASGELAKKLEINSLDLRSGKLELSLSQEVRDDLSRISLEQGIPRNRLALSIVESLAQIVSPYEECDNNGLIAATARLFPGEISHDSEPPENINPPSTRSSFTAAGVLWLSRKRNVSEESWILCREPAKNSTQRALCKWGNKLSNAASDDTDPLYPFWSWQLFDNRYWIRVRDRRGYNVTARLLTEKDMFRIRRDVDRNLKKRTHIESLLREIAPGKIRWSLPALVQGESDEILALPTLGSSLAYAEHWLEWQILYKRI